MKCPFCNSLLTSAQSKKYRHCNHCQCWFISWNNLIKFNSILINHSNIEYYIRFNYDDNITYIQKRKDKTNNLEPITEFPFIIDENPNPTSLYNQLKLILIFL